MVRPRPLLRIFQWPFPFLKLKCSNFIFEHLIFGQKWCFIRINPHFPRHIRTYTGCKPIKKQLSAIRDKQTVVKLMKITWFIFCWSLAIINYHYNCQKNKMCKNYSHFSKTRFQIKCVKWSQWLNGNICCISDSE